MAFNPYIPACFIDFITSQEVCNSTMPTSGLYIENLSGISAKSLAVSANSNNGTAKDNLQDRVTMALHQIAELLKQEITQLGYVFRAKGTTQTFCGCFGSQYSPAIGAVKKGIEIRKNSDKGQYNSLLVESVILKSNTNGAHTVELQDDNGTILQALTVSLQAGKATRVPVQWDLKIPFGSSYRIVWANSNATPVLSSCHKNNTLGCCGNIPNHNSNNTWYEVNGWDGSQCSQQGYGIAIQARIQCEVQNLLCGSLDELKMAILYLTGCQIVDTITSPQRTHTATANADWYVERKMEWQQSAMDIVKNFVQSNLERIIEDDTFCIFRPARYAPVVAPFGNLVMHPVKEAQAAKLGAQQSYLRAIFKPVQEYYEDLSEDIRTFNYQPYGAKTMFWGYGFI